jgi:hypothetical protein
MLKAIYAVIAAALLAASFFAALSISAEVEARGSVPGAKGDRADARLLAGACSVHPWPYFEAACLRDTRNPFGQTEDVRLIPRDGSVSLQGEKLRLATSEMTTPVRGREVRHAVPVRRADSRAKAKVR